MVKFATVLDAWEWCSGHAVGRCSVATSEKETHLNFNPASQGWYFSETEDPYQLVKEGFADGPVESYALLQELKTL